MDAGADKVLHPFAVWGKSLAIWGRNFLPLVALSSVSLLLARVLQLSKPLWCTEPATAINIAFSTLFVIEIIAALVAHAFMSLLVINHIKGYCSNGVVFQEAFDVAKKGLLGYLKTVIVLLLFVFVLVNLAAFLLGLGESAFRVPGGDRGIKLAILIGSGTVFVAALLSIFWYGFFFSFSPLVAAYEKTGVWKAIAESRRRIKGNAFRYLTVLVVFFIVYVGLGILAIRVMLAWGVGRYFVNAVDPVMLLVFSPLWLALWYLSYEKLTGIKMIEKVENRG